MIEYMDVLNPPESSAKCSGASISKGHLVFPCVGYACSLDAGSEPAVDDGEATRHDVVRLS